MKDSLGMQVGHSSCHVLCDLDPHRPRELYGRVKQQVFETATIDVLQIKGEEKKRREGGREGGREGRRGGAAVGMGGRKGGGGEGGREGGREEGREGEGGEIPNVTPLFSHSTQHPQTNF